jgi:hypothetical protein
MSIGFSGIATSSCGRGSRALPPLFYSVGTTGTRGGIKELEWVLQEFAEELIHEIGADHILFGSDYPHPEGLADPVSWSA